MGFTQSPLWPAAVGFLVGAAVTGVGAIAVMTYRKPDEEPFSSRKKRQAFQSGEADRLLDEYVPPLPDGLKSLLAEASLCHLSCKDGDEPPHTSLMNYTFVEEEQDIIIMTTRRDTRKFVLMQKHPEVALLLHDFPITESQRQTAVPNSGSQVQRTLSVSVRGIARIEGGQRAEQYRNMHLEKNRDYAQFIAGEDKAVVTIKILSARMCNIMDKVTEWESGKTQGKACGMTRAQS